MGWLFVGEGYLVNTFVVQYSGECCQLQEEQLDFGRAKNNANSLLLRSPNRVKLVLYLNCR